MPFRPEIDGLRAIAIISVFVFHLDHGWLPGGFVGVDVFFVISGYLITSILYHDLQTGRFNLARFYQRRIARIVPAFFSVALATFVAAAIVYTPQDFASAGAALVAASLFVANIKFMTQGNYFQVSADAQPFLHYWTLSVEEQFYLVFPLLLFFLYTRVRERLLPTLVMLCLCSLFACVLITDLSPVWAFYLFPTRAWELGVGCLLAVVPFPKERQATIFRAIPALGLVMIGASVVFIHEGPLFPGWLTVFPVAGAAAIVMARPNSHTGVSRWLSSGPMASLGRMSYSLYLWHWPVFCVIDYHFLYLGDIPRTLLKTGVSLLFATASFHLIETPARNFLNQTRARTVAFGATTLLVAICIAMGAAVRRDNYINAEPSDVAKGGLVFPGRPGAASIILMGDSNASMYGKLMKEICDARGLNLTVISVAAGQPLPGRNGELEKLWVDSLEVIRKTRPNYLVLANYWTVQLRGDPERLRAALLQIAPFVGHVILLNQPPTLPKEASRSSIRRGKRPPFREDDTIRNERRKANNLLDGLRSPTISVVDVASRFETKEGNVLFFDEQGHQLYHDRTHLSGFGAERIRSLVEEAVTADH